VAHSLGGLVVRKYVLEEVKLGRRLRVDKILLYAVPNHGSTLGTIGNFVAWQHNQLRQLCMNSDYLEELNADWKNFRIMDKVQVCFVVGGQDRAVSKQSAVEQWGEERVHYVLDADHRTIVKPQRADSLSYRIFRQFLLGPVRVFLSVGGGRTPVQDRFVEAVQTLCQSRNLDARTVDQYSTTNRQPLKDVEYRMDRCFGAIVLAFERAHVESGMWRRGVPQLATPMNNVRLPTVWNQIEAAMAYSRGLPLLVLAEHGLHSEGMLESRYDWRVKWVNLSTFSIDDAEFNGMFEDWRGNVVGRRDGAIATG
jgi:hypothetical protein